MLFLKDLYGFSMGVLYSRKKMLDVRLNYITKQNNKKNIVFNFFVFNSIQIRFHKRGRNIKVVTSNTAILKSEKSSNN